jgi:hypothetical protein
MTLMRYFAAFIFAAAGLAIGRPACSETPTNAVAAVKVLFIGNSFTYGNNLPAMVQSLSSRAKQPLAIDVESVVRGGEKLEGHWNKGVALKKIQEGGWTHVVLQDYSDIALKNKETMFKYMRLFDAAIKKSGAKTILYMTWTYKDMPERQGPIADAYCEIGKELAACVVPVGLAREAALKRNPDAAIYSRDNKHPSPQGTYLAACLFYATLSGHSPIGLPPDAKDGRKFLAKLSAAAAEFYQRIAAEMTVNGVDQKK